MKQTFFITLVAALAVISLNSCDKENGVKHNERQDITLTKAQEEYVKAGNEFSIDFFKEVSKANESLVISPLSAQILLGTINNGLKGQASEEICSVLGYGSKSPESVNEYLHSIIDQLAEVDKTSDLSLANLIMFNTFYDQSGLSREFRSTVEKFYSVHVEEFDFMSAPSKLDEINSWVKKETKGMIEELTISPTLLDVLFAANAVYFEGKWKSKFDEEKSKDSKFNRGDASSSTVKMMFQQNKFRYGYGDDYTFVRLPYGNGGFEMSIILPDDVNGLPDLVKSLTKEKWTAMYKNTSEHDVYLYLPKFKTTYDNNISGDLSAMGITSIFNGSADYSGFAKIEKAFNQIFQQATIEVSESGVKASAVTHTDLAIAPAPDQNKPVEFKADHPFVYVISEISTGTILFMGQYFGD